MLEIKSYTKSELTEIFRTKDTEGLKRKMDGYGIKYKSKGWGKKTVFEIQEIKEPFKVFCITELGFDGRTDYTKLRNFYYYFFNDDEFMAMPDEVKENRMRKIHKDISRQTIATYTRRLIMKNYVCYHNDNFIYYFAYKDNQIITDRKTYGKAWSEYWKNIESGVPYIDAISEMIFNYDGVARKQAIPEINGIYLNEINYMNSLIQLSLEEELNNKN